MHNSAYLKTLLSSFSGKGSTTPDYLSIHVTGLLGPDADGPNAGNCSTVGVDQALPLPTLAAAESPPIGGATASPGKRPAPQEPPTQVWKGGRGRG